MAVLAGAAVASDSAAAARAPRYETGIVDSPSMHAEAKRGPPRPIVNSPSRARSGGEEDVGGFTASAGLYE